jgi:hypothetical protein
LFKRGEVERREEGSFERGETDDDEETRRELEAIEIERRGTAEDRVR